MAEPYGCAGERTTGESLNLHGGRVGPVLGDGGRSARQPPEPQMLPAHPGYAVAVVGQSFEVSEFTARVQLVITLRVAIAAALGAVIGWERGRNGRSAGMRTHMLVSAAAGLAVGVGAAADQAMGNGDPTRALHAVVTGVGFLGGGLIFVRSQGSRPSGVTSAATIFLVAVIGCTAGLGAPILAVTVTALSLGTLLGISQLETYAKRMVPPIRRRRNGDGDDHDDNDEVYG